MQILKKVNLCIDLINRIAKYDKMKRVCVIAFGGGVVGDLAGFVAAVYKRGVPYVQLPTTLLAQADSAIGGKVAVDLKIGKNLVGAFYQPGLVISEIDFLSTLPGRQVRAGIAEIIKYGVIGDAGLFGFIEKNIQKLLRLDKKALEFVVERSSRIKASVVAKDERDTLGIRAVLNYGHTIGHAVETATGYSGTYSHGEAISIGMAAANHIAVESGLLSGPQNTRIIKLLSGAGLPVFAKRLSAAGIYAAHLRDKKFIHGKNRFVLPIKIGKVKVVEGIPEKTIRKAINLICGGRIDGH
ncbi:MAG: 3-dehydroquinate synthase [Candidatus Omnitrophica bacterium]|nr:3-dehydroquinate synthase [Candidatus Omnitrophota bacterium]